MITQFEQIKKSLTEKIPSELTSFLPDKWEKIGDVAIIKLHDTIRGYDKVIGNVYADVLQL